MLSMENVRLIKEAFISFLNEQPKDWKPTSDAGKEAKRRGLVPHASGWGRYVNPADPKKVVAITRRGKLTLVPGTKKFEPKSRRKPEKRTLQQRMRQHAKHKGGLKLKDWKKGRTTKSTLYGVPNDSEIKDRVLKEGYVYGVAAPGSPGSALQEILTGEGIQLVRKNPWLMYDVDALTDTLMHIYGGTELAKQNGVGREQRMKFRSTAMAAVDEVWRIQKFTKERKWDYRKLQIDHYYGARNARRGKKTPGSIPLMIKRVRAAIKKGEKFITPDGKKLTPAEMSSWVESSGAGANPSDTAIFIRNPKTKQTMIMFTSNKLNTGDPQSNSTLGAEFDDDMAALQRVRDEGLSYSEDQLGSASTQLQKAKREIAEMESDLGGVVLKKMAGVALRDINGSYKLFTGNMQEAGPSRNSRQQLKNDKAAWEMTKKKMEGYLSGTAAQRRAGEAKEFHFRSDRQAFETLMKWIKDGTIKKTALSVDKTAKLLGRRMAGGGFPSKNKLTSKIRGEVIDKLAVARAALNKHKDKEGIGLGDTVTAMGVAERFHIALGFEDEGEGIMAYDNLMAVEMGGVRVDSEVMRHCVGVPNFNDFRKNFSVSKPVPVRDEEGNLTAAKIEIYRVDAEGKRKNIGVHHVRTKGGNKFQTTFVWHKDMQDCFTNTHGNIRHHEQSQGLIG